MPDSTDRLPARQGWPWTPTSAQRAHDEKKDERKAMNMQAEVARLALEAIRLANELGATVRRLEEAQFEYELASDGQSMDLARAAIRRAGAARR